MLMVEKPKFGGLWFESSTYVQLVIDASVHCKVSPLTHSMCKTVALDFKNPKNWYQIWDPLDKFPVMNRIEPKVLGSALSVLDLGTTRGITPCLGL